MRFESYRRRSRLALAAALAILALAVPAASARPADDFLHPQPYEPPVAKASPAGTARDISSDPGFDWAAAAIGAGAAIALLLLGSMAAITFADRGRARRAPETRSAGMPIKTRR